MKIIIIGGGATGASCAARLRRLDERAEITLLEQTNEISIANCGLPYYISDTISDRDDILVSDTDTFKNWFNIDVHLNTRVVRIKRDSREVVTDTGVTYPYDKLVLALGAAPFLPDTPGLTNSNVFTLRHLADADKIKDHIQHHAVQKAVVIGGGFIGLEMVENLKHMGIDVSLVEACGQILNPFDTDIADVAQNTLLRHGVTLYLNTTVQKIAGDQVYLSSGQILTTDIVIAAIGVRPETGIAVEAGLETGLRGAIRVNSNLQTSDPNIYAGGDSIEVKNLVCGNAALIPLAGPANRQGRIIADNIAGISSMYQASQGSSIIRLFDTAFAMTGATERGLQGQNKPYHKIHVWANSHASYYPDAHPVLIKLIFGHDGIVFGAQAYGQSGVDKITDVIASLIRHQATVTDLIEAELCYAPPFNSAKSPVNIAGMAAENVLRGFVTPCFDLDSDAVLIDVRPAAAFARDALPQAINIPIAELRNAMPRLPQDKKIIVYCAKGYTGYVAACLLRQEGFKNIFSLSGGLMFLKDRKTP